MAERLWKRGERVTWVYGERRIGVVLEDQPSTGSPNVRCRYDTLVPLTESERIESVLSSELEALQYGNESITSTCRRCGVRIFAGEWFAYSEKTDRGPIGSRIGCQLCDDTCRAKLLADLAKPAIAPTPREQTATLPWHTHGYAVLDADDRIVLRCETTSHAAAIVAVANLSVS